MGGLCSASNTPCTSNLDCPSNQTCTGSHGQCSTTNMPCTSDGDCTTSETCTGARSPLRLNVLTCRNRRPGLNNDQKAFPFDRSNWSGKGIGVQTRVLDDLAAHSAVFPRAHLAGIACTASRHTFMLGRHQRHLNYLLAGGSGALECQSGPPKGCSSNSDCTGASGPPCRPVRTIPRLLSDLTADDNKGFYRTLGAGKVEFYTGNDGFTSENGQTAKAIGKWYCTDGCRENQMCTTDSGQCQQCATCESALNNQGIPQQAKDNEWADIRPFIETYVDTGSDNRQSKLMNPFFIWYGPNVPHEDPDPDPYFNALYSAAPPSPYACDDPNQPCLGTEERQHFARISWFDVGLGTVLDYLKGACVCMKDSTNTATRMSLYDTTVVIVLNDNGFFLPHAKRTWTENGHRTTLIVSEPGHRLPTPAPKPHVFGRDFAHASDLMQTILGYASIPLDQRPQYGFGHDLKPLIQSPSTLRDVQYGEKGEDHLTPKTGPHYAINRPGLVGVCERRNTLTGHFRPCVHDNDCGGNEGEGSCHLPEVPGTSKAKRCVNRLDMACDTDADCADSRLCRDSVCLYNVSLGSYADFDGRPCPGGPGQCVPEGVCQEVVLKAEASSSANLKYVWDVNENPDQDKKRSLLKLDRQYPGDEGYVGPCLRSQFEQCLWTFRHYDQYAKQIPPPRCWPPTCGQAPGWGCTAGCTD